MIPSDSGRLRSAAAFESTSGKRDPNSINSLSATFSAPLPVHIRLRATPLLIFRLPCIRFALSVLNFTALFIGHDYQHGLHRQHGIRRVRDARYRRSALADKRPAPRHSRALVSARQEKREQHRRPAFRRRWRDLAPSVCFGHLILCVAEADCRVDKTVSPRDRFPGF